MVFADIGDRLSLCEGAESLSVGGPFAAALAEESDNLVIRARDAFLAAASATALGFGLTLHKALPIASGLGGGSSDAAATLRLLNGALAKGAAAAVCREIAAGLGSDVAACLAAVATLADGRGDRLTPPPAFPDLDAVLVNPGVRSDTAQVYGAFDATGSAHSPSPPPWPAAVTTAQEMADFLIGTRNDLEDPAIRLAPAIGEALDILRRRPEALLARMSGSGATCFAVCADAMRADRLRAGVSQLRPAWWVRRCRLFGHRPSNENGGQ